MFCIDFAAALGWLGSVLEWFGDLLGWEDELILRGAGVALALLGAVLTSPHGWKRLLFRVNHWMKSKLVAAQMWLSKYLKFIPRPNVTVGVLSAEGHARAYPPRVVAGTNIPADATPDTKLVLLEKALRQLETLVHNDFAYLDGQVVEVKKLVSEIGEQTAELHNKMVKAQHDAASIDAAGIPVIWAGIMLSGIPRELALYPIVGWIILAASIILGIAMTRQTIKDGAWGKKGSEA